VSSRARHPRLHEEWRTSLRITNDTGYDTRAIRKIVVRALKAVCLPVRGAVRIAYSAGSFGDFGDARYRHHGEAVMGSTHRREDGSFVTYQGLTMVLTLPRKPEEADVGYFARVALHEALHWKGVDHKDMTENQLHCAGPLPEWAEGISLTHAVRCSPSPDALRAKRLAHAQKMLRNAERKAKLAQTIVKRWKRRTSALERAARKKAGP